LLYPDNRVQHAGIILGHGGIAGHAWEGESPAEPMEPFPELVFSHTHNVSAVTGACMLLKTSFYKGVGGMDESLAVTFNDVDLCMRLRSEGLRILMCPQACLLHDESASRGSEDTPQKVARFHEEIRIFVHRWQAELEKGDPFYNPNLTLVGRSWTAKDELREDRKPYRQYLHL
jgi:GT2 family glycosyltransferase